MESYPARISGGEQQRVALARALVLEPKVLLLDEPLSNLDAKLRVRVREDIREIQQRIGITTVFVTHDQDEALSISDRIAVMSGGKVEQYADARSLYREPETTFVANFVGSDERLRAAAAPGPRSSSPTASGSRAPSSSTDEPGEFEVGVRPEDVQVSVRTGTAPRRPSSARCRAATTRSSSCGSARKRCGPSSPPSCRPRSASRVRFARALLYRDGVLHRSRATALDGQ